MLKLIRTFSKTTRENMKLFKILALLLFCGNVCAADWYVRSAATGTATGTDWTNAFTVLPTTLIRGDTYFIATGAYPGRVFDTAASGTSVITIKGATVADHGTNTGWNNTYSVATTQAVWTSGVEFNTSYWVFDGNYRVNLSKIATDYGFRMPSQHACFRIFNDSMAITNISVRNSAAIAPSGDIEKWFLWTSNFTQSVDNVTITGILADGFSNTVHATSPGPQHTNWTFEHSASINGYSSEAQHGEDINNNYAWHNNFVIRYNLFEGRTSGTGTIVVLNGPSGPYEIYGNIFKDQASGFTTIGGVHYNLSGNIYNNTFIRIGCIRWGNCALAGLTSANFRNNLFYQQLEYDGVGSGYSSFGIGFGTTGVVSHNSFYDVPQPVLGSQTDAHVTTGSPFVNFAAEDYRLSSPTQAGITLAAPYNMDMYGSTRGIDGVFDRGAIDYSLIGNPIIPISSSLVILQNCTGAGCYQETVQNIDTALSAIAPLGLPSNRTQNTTFSSALNGWYAAVETWRTTVLCNGLPRFKGSDVTILQNKLNAVPSQVITTSDFAPSGC